MADDTISVHADPVWRDRSNFIIKAALPEDGRTEQLWAKQLTDHTFELCCIPFFLYDVALGDVVETDQQYQVTRVVKPSDRFVFRIWFGDSHHPQDDIVAGVVALGALVERSSSHLLAVDAENAVVAKAVADFLQGHEDEQHLMYETGRTA